MSLKAAPRQELTLFMLQRPEVIASPWSYYARLRSDAPVHFDPYTQSWLLSRYEHVTSVLGDARFSVAMRHEPWLSRLPAREQGLRRALSYLDEHVSFVDPPEHKRIRTALAAPFQPRHVRELEIYVAGVVADALERLSSALWPDVVVHLASPVPLRVIQHLLGLDDVELRTLRGWSNAWGDVVGAPGHVPTGDREQLLAAVDQLVERLESLVYDHRAGTVTSALAQSARAGELSDGEVLANLMMLVTAGNETTANLISNAVLALLEDPELWEQLRAERTLLPLAIEELARVHPPTQYTARTANEEVRIDGHIIERGQAVVLLLAAANRDPEMFDEPDTIRLDRSNARRHVAFGNGPHFCFGAPLARLEARLAVDGLLDRPRPQQAGPPMWRLNANLRGLESLPVRWSTGVTS